MTTAGKHTSQADNGTPVGIWVGKVHLADWWPTLGIWKDIDGNAFTGEDNALAAWVAGQVEVKSA